MLDFNVILPYWLQWDQNLQVFVAYLNEFIKCNYVSLGLLLYILKYIATKSKNNYDNKIVTYLSNLIKVRK